MTKEKEIKLSGIGVSSGIVVGKVRIFVEDITRIKSRRISHDKISREIARFQIAIKESKNQLHQIRKKIANVVDEEHAQIFDAHLLVIEDRVLIDDVENAIKKEFLNAEYILQRVANKYANTLEALDDSYLSDRAQDIRDVLRRIISNLNENSIINLKDINEECVVIAEDLLPSDTAGLNTEKVKAFVTDLGSTTSHTAIMARALMVPAIVGLGNITEKVNNDDTILIDGAKGIVFLNPSSKTLRDYQKRANEQDNIRRELESLRDKPSETLDGYKVPLTANIELLEELQGVGEVGAKGIGLYRTEFLFLGVNDLPDEQAQFNAYSLAAKSQYPSPVVIRTLDLGADKMPDGINHRKEKNPFLGNRSIRLSLGRPELFRTQLRAILRASIYDNVRLMYPMVSCEQEVVEANSLLKKCMKELDKENVSYNKNIDIGTMIEVPSAALVADKIAPHVSFFSIGTNDLIQYTMAVDRGNKAVAHLYKPTHIAVIRLIDHLVKICHRFNLWSCVCGQMASIPHLVPLLVGLGVDELSVSPKEAPLVKDVIRKLYYTDAIELAQRSLISESADEVEKHCIKMIKKIAPEVLEFS